MFSNDSLGADISVRRSQRSGYFLSNAPAFAAKAQQSERTKACMLNFWLTATEFCQCYVSAGEGQKGLESVLIGQFTYSFSGADVCVELQKIWSCCRVWCISTALQKVRTHHGTFSMQICRPERCCRLPPLCRWGQRCRGHWKYLKSRERDDEWCNIPFFFIESKRKWVAK